MHSFSRLECSFIPRSCLLQSISFYCNHLCANVMPRSQIFFLLFSHTLLKFADINLLNVIINDFSKIFLKNKFKVVGSK